MSYHIKLNDYFCSKCKAQFIPFEEGILCSNCKAVAENIPKENLGFIDELICSLMVNKHRGGEFIPMGWLFDTFTDSIQSTIFDIFYAWDNKKPKDGELFIREYIKKLRFENADDLYLREHINSIALKVYSRRKELHFSWWNEFLRKLLYKIMP